MANSRSLKKKLETWAKLRKEMDKLEQSIKSDVLSKKETVRHGGAVAKYSNGRGSYDYERAITEKRENGELTKSAVENALEVATEVVVDWRRVCQAVGLTLEQGSRYYKPGNPIASIGLDKSVIG